MKSIGRFLLGMFVLWQVFFLLAHNLLTMLEEARGVMPDWSKQIVERVDPQWLKGKGELYNSMNSILTVTDAYSDLTAQPQGWSLFAPNPSSEITFVALEMSWDDDVTNEVLQSYLAPLIASGDGKQLIAAANMVQSQPRRMLHASEWLFSENEPANRMYYFRFGNFRLRRYEGNIDVILRRHEDETEQEARKRWKSIIDEEIRRDWDAMLAYMKWRVAKSSNIKQNELPKQVILHVRRYHIPPPGDEAKWDWAGPYSMPVARWLPNERAASSVLPIQMYDPVLRRFVWVKW